MLEHFYQSSRRLRQLRQTPFAAHIDALAEKFHKLGYGRKYGRRLCGSSVNSMTLRGQSVSKLLQGLMKA